jgi:hypothetical protein
MNWKAQQQLMDKTEQELLQHIYPQSCKEELFWWRVDGGIQYLLARYEYEEAKRIWKTKKFWKWFRQTWHINDRKILHHLAQRKEGIQMYKYIETQAAKMNEYRMTKGILASIK